MDLKNFPQKEARDIVNLFNRGTCREHKRHLAEAHLLEHGIALNYAKIKDMLRNRNDLEIRSAGKNLVKIAN